MVHPISLDTEHLRCMTLIAYVKAKFGQVRVWYAPTPPENRPYKIYYHKGRFIQRFKRDIVWAKTFWAVPFNY